MRKTKWEWRTELKRKPQNLTAQEKTARSVTIVERLKTIISWGAIATVHCYEPIASLNEPDISTFVSYLRDEHPHITVYTSRKQGNTWHVVRLDARQRSGIQKFDVIIVPMLGFDDSLHRLGYGGGYYDRFLATQPAADKIGICFELGHIETVPAETHDISMNVVITELGVYSRSA